MFAPIRTMIVGVALDNRDATTFAHAAYVARRGAGDGVFAAHRGTERP